MFSIYLRSNKKLIIMANKNYTGHNESFKIDRKNGEIYVHHTDFNKIGRRSYDYSISGGSHRYDHETRKSDNKHNDV